MLQGEGVMPDTYSLSLKWLRGDGRERFQIVRVNRCHSRTAAYMAQEQWADVGPDFGIPEIGDGTNK